MTSYPCPSCRTPADLTSGCPSCGRGPDPDAAEVIRLDAEIPVLTARLTAAREAVAGADAALRRAWHLRQAAVARIQASLAPVTPALVPLPPRPPLAAPRTKEASTRLVQNALFLLGGLLLGVAAIVFTAVAWSQFGVGGRALLLTGFTVAALAAPLAALRRGLTATAETFAAVGLLLVLLDGYAAWYVNLFGVADYSALGYAGAVCAVTAAVAAGYEHVTGLIGPRFGALLVAQPVLPLLVAPFHPDAIGWAYTLVAVAGVNLAVVQLRRSGLTALGVTAYALGGGAAIVGALAALTGLFTRFAAGEVALAGGALIAAAGVPVAAAVLARAPRSQSITGGLMVVALAVAAGRFAAVAGGSFAAPVLVAGVVAALAALVTVVRRRLPAAVRRGPWIGALLVVAGTGVVVVGVTIAVAATGDGDWRLLAVIALLTGGLTVLVPRGMQAHAVLGGLALAAVAAPAGFGLPWWTAPGFELVVVAAALGLALRVLPLWPGAVAVVLTTHAVTVAFGRPWVACATLSAVAVIGISTALVARRAGVLGGVALAVGMVAVPAAAWSGAAALSLSDPVQSRVALGAAALLVGALLVIGRGYRPYALAAALLGVVSAPVWALATGDSPAIYAATALVLVALTFSRTVPAGLAALPLGIALVLATAPSLSAVLLQPYEWLGQVWSGRPDGTGVGAVARADVGALGVLAVAVVIAVQGARGRRAAVWAVAPVLAVIAPMGLAAAGVPWPGVPAESLVVGLAGLLAVALLRPGMRAAGPAVTGAALAGAGLAGALATRGATLAALGLTLVAGAVAGVAGRALAARLAGWLTGAGAAVAFAWTVGRAAELSPATSALVVLGAAAVILAVGATLTGRRADAGRAVEGLAVEVAAHAGALVALLLTDGSIRHAAAVCTFWGLALGVRALCPGAAAPVRRGHVLAAAVAELGGWWLLLASEEVATVEAYTVPAAAVALLAGWLARRSRPGLSSWVTYGPALAAALLPTLASALADEGQPLRRLLLGLGALAVLLAGAHRRLRAPVVAGGTVLAVVALHEVVLVWDLLPRWIPLAAAGLLLVGLAMTLERRRRDLARVRSALGRMG
ncbi:SCO7613 C-terminal domain-containing membrane protein [Actinoplanes sp. NPDC004185]